MTDQEIGRWLRSVRLQAGVTQELVARLANTTQAQIARVELGTRGATLRVLAGYARAAGPEPVLRLYELAIAEERAKKSA